MIEFRIKPHENRNCNVVEIFDNNHLLGVIYPEQDRIRLVSKYLSLGNVWMDATFPTVLEVKLP